MMPGYAAGGSHAAGLMPGFQPIPGILPGMQQQPSGAGANDGSGNRPPSPPGMKPFSRAGLMPGLYSPPKAASFSPPPIPPPPPLVFVTGNTGKLTRARLALSLRSLSRVQVQGVDLKIPEIQADSVKAVAMDKARRAFEELKRPLIVHDCGLVCAALKDFPGPATKYANYTIGTEGLLNLMREKEDRRAGWADVIVHVDANGKLKTFEPEEDYTGIISETPPRKYLRFKDNARALGRVFVATDFFGKDEDRCLADVTEEEYQRYRREAPSVWNDFAEWYEKRLEEEEGTENVARLKKESAADAAAGEGGDGEADGDGGDDAGADDEKDDDGWSSSSSEEWMKRVK